MRQERKQKDRFALVLILSFCLMALVSVFAVKSGIDRIRDNIESGETADVVKEKAVEETKDEATGEVVDSRESENSGSSGGGTSGGGFVAPLSGEIVMPYSMDMPVYWETLDQYMTHGGVDLAASAGTEVKSCAAGTVTRVDEDDRFGVVVEINHGNGIISRYGNLAEDGLVELGEVVAQGETIGKVGKTARFESSGEEHLHFEMRKDDEPVNPSDYIRL